MTEIGALFSPHLLEERVLSALMRRLSVYRQEAQVQHGVKLPEIASWGLVDEDEDRWPEQELPALIVVAGGIGKGGEPEEYQGGWYRAAWSLSVTVIVEHAQMVKARLYAQVYGAVIRGAVLQERSLRADGLRVDWTGELNPYRGEKKRTEAATENFFLVTKDEVVNWRMGPKSDQLEDTPPGPSPEATEIEVDPEVAQ